MRRAVAATAIVAGLSLFGAGPAFAQLPLGGALSGDSSTAVVGGVVDTVSDATSPLLGTQEASGMQDAVSSTADSINETADPVTSAADPVLEQAKPAVQETTATVQSTVQPVLDTAAPAVQQTTATVHSTVQPVLDTAAPLLDAAEPIVGAVTQPILTSTSPLLEAAAPVLDATGSLLQSAAPLLSATTELTGAVASTQIGGEPMIAAPGAQQTADPIPALPVPASSPATVESTTGDGRASGAVLQITPALPRRLVHDAGRPAAQAPVFSTMSPPSTDWATSTARSGRGSDQTSGAAPHRPSPWMPGNPFGLSSVAAGSPSGASLLVFAAFAAALLLAAPGLGRRLRPNLAPWPRPIALPSLERPG